jgi:probable phosphoglycerate mutase
MATGEITADVLISSTLPRARQTAEIIAPALGLPIIFDDDVQEQSVGDLDGMRWDEVESQIADNRQEPFKPFGPGGENWGQFVLRVGTALDRILHEHDGKTIVIVCHGGVIDASFLFFFGINTLVPPVTAFHTRNTSITLWEQHRVDEYSQRWGLTGYNDFLHTRDIDEAERIQWARFARPLEARQETTAIPLPTEEG